MNTILSLLAHSGGALLALLFLVTMFVPIFMLLTLPQRRLDARRAAFQGIHLTPWQKCVRALNILRKLVPLVGWRSGLCYSANSFLPEFAGSHVRSFTGSDTSITGQYMVVKRTGTGTIAACAAVTDQPIGICIDQYNASYTTAPLTVILFGANRGLVPCLISAGFIEGAMAYSDGAGGINAAPTTASAQGTYWRIGMACTVDANSAGTCYVALAPCVPVQVGVITATGATTVANIVTLLKLATTAQEVLFN